MYKAKKGASVRSASASSNGSASGGPGWKAQRTLVAFCVCISVVLFLAMRKPVPVPPTQLQIYSREEIETFLYEDEAVILKGETVDADQTEAVEAAEQAEADMSSAAPEVPPSEPAEQQQQQQQQKREPSAPKRPCETWDDIKEGNLTVGFKGFAEWVPSSGCQLEHGRRVNWVKRCILQRRFVFLGDVLTYFFATKVAFEGRTPYARNRKPFYLSNGLPCKVRNCGFRDVYRSRTGEGRPYAFYHVGDATGAGSLSRNETLEAVRDADVVVYGTTLLDMGPNYVGPADYLTQSIDRLSWLKEQMKPDATLVALPVHSLHTSKLCPKEKRCYRCYSPKKADVYREALILAASCTGTPVLNVGPMTRDAAHYAKGGGLWYNMKERIGASIFLQALCGGRPNLLMQPSGCDARSAKARWSEVRQAQIGCRPASTTKHDDDDEQ